MFALCIEKNAFSSKFDSVEYQKKNQSKILIKFWYFYGFKTVYFLNRL